MLVPTAGSICEHSSWEGPLEPVTAAAVTPLASLQLLHVQPGQLPHSLASYLTAWPVTSQPGQLPHKTYLGCYACQMPLATVQGPRS
jgi:hypothetical protein